MAEKRREQFSQSCLWSVGVIEMSLKVLADWTWIAYRTPKTWRHSCSRFQGNGICRQ